MAEQKKIARRTFFAGLGLATAAGVAAKLSAPAAQAVQTATEATDSDKYRLSEHVKKYYRTTTI
jgi:hypothetical protein